MNVEDPSTKVIELRTRRCLLGAGKYEHGPFIVDQRLNTVECGTCGKELHAGYVLSLIARWEENMRERHRKMKELVEEAAARNRTKCEHCREMTRVVKR